MNKKRRHDLKMLKFIRRLKNYGLYNNGKINLNGKGNWNALRSTGKPCSCALCSPGKIKQSGLRKVTSKEIKEIRCEAYEYLIP